jgi:hypothetical protein
MVNGGGVVVETCTAEFARLTAGMGRLRCDGNAFVTLTNPLTLQHWTMPLIEFTLVAGLIASFIHALRWHHRHRDASNLVLSLSGIVCLLVIEPFTYFPQWFGLEDSLGVTFVHNLFTVQFLYDRLPLYIVAMYPVFAYTAWTVVQRTGIFRIYHPLVGACCVTFVFYALYEVIDMVGPQFRWWVWNENLSTSVPTFGHVPMLNMQAFSLALPFAMAIVTLVVSKPGRTGGRTVARNVMAVSVLVWPILFLSSLPSLLLTLVGVPVPTARTFSTWLLAAVVAVVAAVAFAGALRSRRADPDVIPHGVEKDYLALTFVVVYLIVGAVCWIAALPGYLAATDGYAPSGGRVGSLPFAAAMALVCAAVIVVAYRSTGAGASKYRVMSTPRA